MVSKIHNCSHDNKENMVISKGGTVINVETRVAQACFCCWRCCCWCYAATFCGGACRHQAMKPHGTFILGEVVRLTDTSATLADGRTLEFDYAAICSGSDYAVGKSNTAVTLDKRRQELKVTGTV